MASERTPFWGLREGGSKGSRFRARKIWHYFIYLETWAQGKGMFSICTAMWPDHEIHTLAKSLDKPLRVECCQDCYRTFNQRMKRAIGDRHG